MSFEFDPAKHDALRWSVVMKDGKRWDRSFDTEGAGWHYMIGYHANAERIEQLKQQGYAVVPIAWVFKKPITGG